MLIRDPVARGAAASLEVGVGTLLEPKQHTGIATFLHHMITAGNADFFAYNGGELNAYTSMTATNYQISIDDSAISEGIDKFASMFMKPAFSDKHKAQEIRLIHH